MSWSDAAREAAKERRMRTGPDSTYHRGMLRVTCWCEAEVIWVGERDVAEGRTASCGAVACKRMTGMRTARVSGR